MNATKRGDDVHSEAKSISCAGANTTGPTPPTHVDDFIDRSYPPTTRPETYARWFLFLHRLPASMQHDFRDWIAQYRLFCSYKGKRYRVTGASRLGDIWLAADFRQDTGYDLRVDLDDCGEWLPNP